MDVKERRAIAEESFPMYDKKKQRAKRNKTKVIADKKNTSILRKKNMWPKKHMVRKGGTLLLRGQIDTIVAISFFSSLGVLFSRVSHLSLGFSIHGS